MDQVANHISEFKTKLGLGEVDFDAIKAKIPKDLNEVNDYVGYLKETIPGQFETYYHTLRNTSKDQIVSDLSELKVTPATVTLSITTLASVIILSRLLFPKRPVASSKKKSDKKKHKKRLSKAQRANKEIQDILDFVEEKYVPEIDDYLESYTKLDDERVAYQYKYFEEMLLKELMKLDGVDVTGNAVLRDNRKKVIKFIQDHQKRLDKFKNEIGL